MRLWNPRLRRRAGGAQCIAVRMQMGAETALPAGVVVVPLICTQQTNKNCVEYKEKQHQRHVMSLNWFAWSHSIIEIISIGLGVIYLCTFVLLTGFSEWCLVIELLNQAFVCLRWAAWNRARYKTSLCLCYVIYTPPTSTSLPFTITIYQPPFGEDFMFGLIVIIL